MDEVKEKKVRAKRVLAKRAATVRRQMRQEDWRESLKIKAYLNNLNVIHDRVKSKWHRMNSDQIAATRLQADINFKLLGKCLPDLKMVEINGEMKHLHHDMNRAEIDGLLLSSGIDPDEAFGQLKIVSN